MKIILRLAVLFLVLMVSPPLARAKQVCRMTLNNPISCIIRNVIVPVKRTRVA